MSLVPDKYCKHCGRLLVRKFRPNGSLEKMKDFKQRIVCDGVCYRGYKYQIRQEPKPEPMPIREWLEMTKEITLPEHLEEHYSRRQYKGAHWLFGGDE